MKLFPTLSLNPSMSNFRHAFLIDPIHRVRFECQTILTRPLFTDVPVGRHLYYDLLDNANKEILENWERDTIVYGGEEFQWFNIKNKKTYTTLLAGPIEYNIFSESSENYWQISLNLIILRESYFLGVVTGSTNVLGIAHFII